MPNALKVDFNRTSGTTLNYRKSQTCLSNFGVVFINKNEFFYFFFISDFCINEIYQKYKAPK